GGSVGHGGEQYGNGGVMTLVLVFLASIYGGYFGSGLSLIVLAVFALVSNDPLTRLNAFKQMISLCVNVAAAIFFLFSGKVIWSATAVVAVWGVGGGGKGGVVRRSGLGSVVTRGCGALAW